MAFFKQIKIFFIRQTDRHTENLWRWVIQLKPIKLIGKALIFHHRKENLMMNDRPCQSTVIRRHSENEFWFDFFFENCRTTLRQCLTWSDKVPTTFWEYSYNNRRRSTTLTLSSLQWIDTVLVLCTVVWKFTIIFEKFISNNCVVFIPKALHLIHLIFDFF